MSKNYLIVIAVIALILVGGTIYFVTSGGNRAMAPELPKQTEESRTQPTPTPSAQTSTQGTQTNEQGTTPVQTQESVVVYTDSGYSPSELRVKAGTVVVFKNQSTKNTWPATAMHPTHTVYPGSDIKKCGTAEASSIFDACRGIAPGEFWSFKFDIVGAWGYHDHLDTSKRGKVIVE